MKLYTKTGDDGTTGLFGGTRVSKASLRVDAYGDVDELNAHIGVAHAAVQHSSVRQALAEIQEDLLCAGSELGSNPDKTPKAGMPLVEEAAVERLENLIDLLSATLPPLTTFILPGGAPAAGALHVARTVCRRAERKVVALSEKATVRNETIRYLNRLSDLLFVMARCENQSRGVTDVAWEGRRR